MIQTSKGIYNVDIMVDGRLVLQINRSKSQRSKRQSLSAKKGQLSNPDFIPAQQCRLPEYANGNTISCEVSCAVANPSRLLRLSSLRAITRQQN